MKDHHHGVHQRAQQQGWTGGVKHHHKQMPVGVLLLTWHVFFDGKVVLVVVVEQKEGVGKGVEVDSEVKLNLYSEQRSVAVFRGRISFPAWQKCWNL